MSVSIDTVYVCVYISVLLIYQGYCTDSKAVRNINTNNETHFCMMNDWSVIRHKPISAMDPPDSTRRQPDIKSTWRLSLMDSVMAACGYWCLTCSRFDLASGWQHSESIQSLLEWRLQSEHGNRTHDISWRPWMMMWTAEPGVKAYCERPPPVSHVYLSVTQTGFFCPSCQNIQCEWCCLFLPALDVSTHNILAAFQQIWQCLSGSGVPAFPFNYEQRISYLDTVWLSKCAVPRISSDTNFLIRWGVSKCWLCPSSWCVLISFWYLQLTPLVTHTLAAHIFLNCLCANQKFVDAYEIKVMLSDLYIAHIVTNTASVSSSALDKSNQPIITMTA